MGETFIYTQDFFFIFYMLKLLLYEAGTNVSPICNFFDKFPGSSRSISVKFNITLLQYGQDIRYHQKRWLEICMPCKKNIKNIVLINNKCWPVTDFRIVFTNCVCDLI